MPFAFALTHWDFVWLSYSLTAFVIASLIAWILLTARSRRAKLAQLSGEQGNANDDG